MRHILSLFALLLVVAVQYGCKEPSQLSQYEDGRYAGKPDTPNWQSDAFDNNAEVWRKELQRRNRLQSEYTRPGGA